LLPQPTGEKYSPALIKTSPPAQATSGEAVTVRFSGGYGIISNNARICGEETVGYIYSDELPSFSTLRTVQLVFGGQQSATAECDRECEITALIPTGTLPGTYRLELQIPTFFEAIYFDIQIVDNGPSRTPHPIEPSSTPPSTASGSTVTSEIPQGGLAFVDEAGTWLWHNGRVTQISPVPAETLRWSPDGRLAYGANQALVSGKPISQPPTVVWLFDPMTGLSREIGTFACCDGRISQWSSDSTHLAVTNSGPYGSAYVPSMAVYDVQDWTVRVGACGTTPTLAPDNHRVVYAGAANCPRGWQVNYSIRLVDWLSDWETWLTTPVDPQLGPAQGWPPIQQLAWSPRGDLIAVLYSEWLAETNYSQRYDWLALLSPDQSQELDPETLRPGILPEPEQPGERLIRWDWSATGDFLAMTATQRDGSRFYLVAPDTPESWTIRDLGPDGKGPPLWSPDDTSIAMSVDPAQIYLYSLPDDEARLLTTGLTDVGQLAWTPDGRALTAVSGDTLYWLPLDGRPPHPLFSRPDLRLTAWAP
jgi:Tol biopolymer transport system component